MSTPPAGEAQPKPLWKKLIWPAVGISAVALIAGITVPLVKKDSDKSAAPNPSLGKKLYCGHYQNESDPSVQLKALEILGSRTTKFPEGFFFGTATSAYQIEGAYNEDGRGMTIWDKFSHTKGKVEGNENGDIACDHYHRYKDDIAMMAKMGITKYRFSIAWSRIIPKGIGALNPKGLKWYSDLIDELIANDIEPYVTLYHWDLPLYLEEENGGWHNHTTADAMAKYADVVFDAYGDRVKNWITLNEPWCSSVLGYGIGVHAPGLKNIKSGHYLAGHNLLLAHAKTVKLYRTKYKMKQGGQIGITINSDYKQFACDTPQDRAAAERAQIFVMGWFADPVFFGDYPKEMRDTCGNRLPKFTEEEKADLKQSLDFLGLNHYTTGLTSSSLIRSTPGNYYTDIGTIDSSDPMWPTAESGWLKDTPWGMRKLLVWIKERYNDPVIIITENGVSGPKENDMTDNESLDDSFRQHYMQGYISEVWKAIAFDKVDVRGYFYWSFMDNFEWADGYRPRFGIIRVNYTDQTRTPKMSALLYQDIIRRFQTPLPPKDADDIDVLPEVTPRPDTPKPPLTPEEEEAAQEAAEIAAEEAEEAAAEAAADAPSPPKPAPPAPVVAPEPAAPAAPPAIDEDEAADAAAEAADELAAQQAAEEAEEAAAEAAADAAPAAPPAAEAVAEVPVDPAPQV